MDNSSLPDKHDARNKNRPPYVSLVPLPEVIAAAHWLKATSKRTKELYFKLTQEVASELDLLLKFSPTELETKVGPAVATAILKMRKGELSIKPGYDGVFGEVEIEMIKEQAALF